MKQESIPDDLREKLDEIAEATGIKRHMLVRFALEEFANDHRLIRVNPYQVAHLNLAVHK